MPKQRSKTKSPKGVVRLRRNNLTRAMFQSLGLNTGLNFNFDHPDDRLLALIDHLQSIDTSKPVAKLNETSITDNNGGRILL